MIFETLIRTALDDRPKGPVPVKGYVRRKPVNHKREEVLSALRRLRDFVPTEGQTGGCSRQVTT